MKKHLVLKILFALVPTLIFMQNCSWILDSVNRKLFLLLWALMIWSVYQLTEKNSIIERLLRLTEISFFLLPVSAIMLSFGFGIKAISSTTNGCELAGSMIGTAIVGTIIVVVSSIIGLAGGFIMHLIGNKYEKKAEISMVKEMDTFSNKHGLLCSLVAIILLVFFMKTTLGFYLK